MELNSKLENSGIIDKKPECATQEQIEEITDISCMTCGTN